MKISKGLCGLAVTMGILLSGCAQQAISSPVSTSAASASQAASVERAALAQGLYELAYSQRQNAVYVASSGGWGDDAQAKIIRLNPRTLAVEGEIPLERKAFGVTLDDEGGRLYVGNTVDLSVTVVDIVNNRVVGTVQLENKVRGDDGKERYPRDLRELAVDAANNRLFLAGHGEESVLYVVDTRTLAVERTIPGLGGPKAPGFAFDKAGERLFITNLRGELITFSTRTLQITSRVQTDVEQPLNIAFDPASQRLFITDQGAASIREWLTGAIPGYQSKNPGNRVAVLDAGSGRHLHNIPTDAGPMGILLDSPRKRLYVTNREAGTVTVYDSASYELLQTIALPTHPNSLALDARGNTVYVSVKSGEADGENALESVARLQF